MELKMVRKNLVLLPGIDGSGKLFEPFLNVLHAPYQAVVASYPTDKILYYQQLIPYIRNIIPWNEPYILVAESFSGPLALEFAKSYWEDIEAVVLCASFVTNPVHSWINLARKVLDKQWATKPPPNFVWKKMMLGEYASPLLLEPLLDTLENLPPDVLAHRINMILSADARQPLKECKAPLLYVQPTEDNLVGTRGYEVIQSVRPDVSLAEIKGPHMLMQTRPREILTVMEQFFRELDKQREELFADTA